jgi:hypothetical protein
MVNLLASIPELSENFVNLLTSSLGIWYLIILNAFGVIALILKVIEYQLKSRWLALTLAMIGTICWFFYFTIQGDFTSALICVIGIPLYIVFLQREKHAWANSIWWLVLFLLLQIGSCAYTFNFWHDAFSLLAGIFGSIAYFVISKKHYRQMSFFYALFWVLNSIMKMYLLAFLNDIFAFISVCVAIVRFDVIPSMKAKKREKFIKQFDNESQLNN